MARLGVDERIVRDMLRYSPCPDVARPQRARNLDCWGVSREVGDLLLKDPNAVLLMSLFNYQIPYERALAAPFELRGRLGHLDPRRLAKMRQSDLLPFVRNGPHGKALHRFPPTLSKRIIAASRKLVEKYDGDASNIWPGGSRGSLVIQRLAEFEGISQKLSRLTTRLLGTYFGVRLTHWNEIDVAVDRHVARVFLRTGLVQRRRGSYAVVAIRNEVIECARRLRPAFPGCLDDPAFAVGRDWCNAEAAYCDWEGEPCPLRRSCRRRTAVSVC